MLLAHLVPPPVTIRVLTYNVHHANPPKRPGTIDLDAIAAAIRAQKPDVVMLQELDVRTRRSGAEVDEAAELGLKTGLGSYFAKAIDFEGGEYGVAILSRYPMAARRRVALPTQEGTKGEPRVLALATLNLPDGTQVVAACTHMDAQRAPTNRRLQADAVAKELAAVGMPAILGGDFNDTPGSETLRTLERVLDRSGLEGAPTFPADVPQTKIDYVTFAPKGAFRIVSQGVVPEAEASDHRSPARSPSEGLRVT
ncbi:endonuclease [bacterium]|nr:MAG: endonuclease [bacterium]